MKLSEFISGVHSEFINYNSLQIFFYLNKTKLQW